MDIAHRHLHLVVLAQALLTLGLLTMTLLPPGRSQAASSPEVRPPAPASQARIDHARITAAKPAPTERSAREPSEAKRSVAPAKVAEAPPASPPSPSQTAPPEVAAADLPEPGLDYRKARRHLLARGFKPARVAPPECRGSEPSVDACWGALVEFPEIEACSGAGSASCTGWWLAPDGRVLRIQTAGGQNHIRDRRWASPGELAELPKDWRP